MNQLRVLLTLSTVSVFAACTGTIEEAARYEQDPGAAEAALGNETAENAANDETANNAEPSSDTVHDDAVSGDQTDDAAGQEPEAYSADDEKVKAEADSKAKAKAEADKKAAADKANAKPKVEDLATRVGVGDLEHPVTGPEPREAAKLKGAPYKLIKNWDFGKNGTIRSIKDLDSEFMYHDHFGTVANGTNYGAVTVASSEQTAIAGAAGLGLPNDRQPVEDPARPFREWTNDSLLAHVRPLSANQTTVSAARHDVGNGSFTAKWNLPKGGKLSGHDMVWETRVRMPKAVLGYWYSVWAAGKKWNKGAEMDVFESFGTQWVLGDAWHADSVGGTNTIDYTNWQNALDGLGIKKDSRVMNEWHTWTWVYLKDDTYEIYFDGKVVQHGSIPWTNGATPDGEPVDVSFLFDFSWGHTQVSEVNIELPASAFPLTYEIDYSRVYMR